MVELIISVVASVVANLISTQEAWPPYHFVYRLDELQDNCNLFRASLFSWIRFVAVVFGVLFLPSFSARMNSE